MPLIDTNYTPHWLFKNGHVHTIYPALFRKPKAVPWQRQVLALTDGDFLDLDWWRTGNSKLVVLGHGLEGSSNSTYILAAAHLFKSQGYDVLAWNQRSCGGRMNSLPRFYHHGVSDDLAEIVAETAGYQQVAYIGYSLGGNVLLKYLGEKHHVKPSNFQVGVAISAPVDLPSCVAEIHRPKNRLYHNRFLKTLKQKVRTKSALMPDKLSTEALANVKSLTDFDTYYTAPLHGFASANEYYQKASSKPLLNDIKIPTLLLQAEDDPMLGAGCFPKEEAKANPFLHLMITKHGGHVAFMQARNEIHFMEEMALQFIDKQLNT